MNKTELIKSVSKSTQVDEDTVRTVFNGIVSTIKERLWYGVNIKIKDFMNFTLETKQEQLHRNPQTGDKHLIPKHYRVKLDLSKIFKDKIKTKTVH